MGTKTSGEIEREFIDGLKNSTGRDLSDWLNEIKASGLEKRNDVLNKLKTEYLFGHMNASLLAGIFANRGKPVYGDTDKLLDIQFSKAEERRPVYNSLIKSIQTSFPNVTVLPKKTYISIFEKREFAAINIKKTEIRLGLDLGDRPFDEVVTKSKLTGPMPRISHQVVLTDESQITGGVIQLMQESYNRSH
jgi:hypothetical protein